MEIMTELMQEYLDAGRSVIGEEVAALEEVALSLDERFAEAVEILLNCKSKVVVTGIGNLATLGERSPLRFPAQAFRLPFYMPVRQGMAIWGCMLLVTPLLPFPEAEARGNWCTLPRCSNRKAPS